MKNQDWIAPNIAPLHAAHKNLQNQLRALGLILLGKQAKLGEAAFSKLVDRHFRGTRRQIIKTALRMAEAGKEAAR
ncbi:MAG: hypothetical protein HY360_07550 [Verrucomicrobia bacterium]|nr:hypothetical protein [Verrucomicrobiota bacterium]